MQLQMSTPSMGLANKSSVEITFLIKHSLQIAGGMDFLCWKQPFQPSNFTPLCSFASPHLCPSTNPSSFAKEASLT